MPNPPGGGAEVTPGVYRHWRGHLYQVLAVARVARFTPGRGGLELFHGQWAGNDRFGGRRMAVTAAPDPTAPHDVHAYATPVGDGEWWSDDDCAVAYIGLELCGRPTPGLRIRLRGLAEFTEGVDVGGRAVPRFDPLGGEWHPGM